MVVTSVFFSLSVLVRKEKSELSILRISKSIEINPEFADACVERAFIYYAKKEHDKAWENVHKAESPELQAHPGFFKVFVKRSEEKGEKIKKFIRL